VKTIDGEASVRVAPGTQHGAVLRLKGHGVPRLDGRGRGDLLMHASVEIPSKLKKEERELFEKLSTFRDRDRGIFRRLRDSLLGE